MTTTPLYAAVLALLFVALSSRVIGMRRAGNVMFGDGGDRMLLRRLRVQANFAEYVPFVVILMAFAEVQNAPVWLLHSMGLVLLVGRLVHAIGLSREPEILLSRTIGMSLTLTALVTGGGANLVLAVL
jgi:hypothetical protein